MQIQYRTSYTNMVDGQWRSPQSTQDGKLVVTVDNAGEVNIGDVNQGDAGTSPWLFNLPTRWKKYTTIPGGGLDLLAEFPGFLPLRIETYADGILELEPYNQPGTLIQVDSFYGWTWGQIPRSIGANTTALPLLVYFQ